MIRMAAVLLGAVSACPAQETKAKPDELFAKMEEKLEKAESLTVRFKGEMGQRPKEKMTGTYSGSLEVGSGDKFSLEMSLTDEGRTLKVSGKSDGKTVTVESQGQKFDAPCPRNFGKFLRRSVSRTGVMVLAFTMGKLQERDSSDPEDVAEAWRTGRLVVGDVETIGKRKARRFEFAIVPPDDTRERANTQLWIDEETMLPLKRVGDWSLDDPMFVFTETYEVSK